VPCARNLSNRRTGHQWAMSGNSWRTLYLQIKKFWFLVQVIIVER
jgi:hypothetical protein